MAITKSELIPKTDGTVLSPSFHVPTDLATGKPANPPARSGGFPVLLSETPYGKSFEDPIDPYLVERGYIGVSVDVAGTGGSNAARGTGTIFPYYPFTQASEKPVTPGLVTRFDIEIRPVFATLKPGHSLRLVLGTGDLPHLMPNTTEGPLLLGGIYSVQHNAASLSWIDIPVGTNPAS
jgi:predicted acyl esterase